MTSINLDLSKLSPDQLNVLRMAAPDLAAAVQEELGERTAYNTQMDAFTALALLTARVEAYVAARRNTQSVRELVELGIIDIPTRVLATARKEGIYYDRPSLADLMRKDSLKDEDPNE